jgi:hypothetical protein
MLVSMAAELASSATDALGDLANLEIGDESCADKAEVARAGEHEPSPRGIEAALNAEPVAADAADVHGRPAVPTRRTAAGSASVGTSSSTTAAAESRPADEAPGTVASHGQPAVAWSTEMLLKRAVSMFCGGRQSSVVFCDASGVSATSLELIAAVKAAVTAVFNVCIPRSGRSAAARSSRPARRCALRALPLGAVFASPHLGGRSAVRVDVERCQVSAQSSN